MKGVRFSRNVRSAVVCIPLVLAATACGSGSAGGVSGPTAVSADTTAPDLLSPGETIGLGATARITASGTYRLAAGGSSLTTWCKGRVDVMITWTPGNPVTNTCDAAEGRSRQTNPVSGLDRVEIRLGPGASAEVTLN